MHMTQLMHLATSACPGMLPTISSRILWKFWTLPSEPSRPSTPHAAIEEDFAQTAYWTNHVNFKPKE